MSLSADSGKVDGDTGEWRPVIRKALPDLTEKGILSEATSSQFRYLPPSFDSRGMLQLRFLLKCEALEIPQDLWPDLEPELPVPRHTHVMLPAFVPPPYDVLRDTAQTWGKKADQAWRKYCKSHTEAIRNTIAHLVHTGQLVPQKQTREKGRSSPIDLRLEWAARHYCQGWSYGELHKRCNENGRYTVAGITSATQTLLDQLGLTGSNRPHF